MSANLEDFRIYSILDTAYVSREWWIETYRKLIQGGADLVQIRAKNESHRERVELLEALLPDYVNGGRPLIVNDDLEAAALYPGMGLGIHLGQDDLDPVMVRERLGAGVLVGLSTHTREQAKEAMELARKKIIDYFAVGPLFKTPTKPDYRPVGLELAKEVMEMNPPVPFFTIGGITRENIQLVVDSGIKRIVVVSDILKSADPAGVIREFRRKLSQ